MVIHCLKHGTAPKKSRVEQRTSVPSSNKSGLLFGLLFLKSNDALLSVLNFNTALAVDPPCLVLRDPTHIPILSGSRGRII